MGEEVKDGFFFSRHDETVLVLRNRHYKLTQESLSIKSVDRNLSIGA